MRKGTTNNYFNWSTKCGGVRKCYEGKPTVAVGGFKVDIDLLPLNAAVPAGTLVYADEQARTITPIYTFKVTAVDSGAKTITVEKFETGTLASAGMKLIPVGADLSQASANQATVASVDSSADDVDVLTVDATTGISVNDVLAVSGDDKKIIAMPNGLTYCDNVRDEKAYAMDIDYVWNCIDKPVLERRMLPLTDSLKKALRDNECYFRFSNRK